MVAGSAVGTLAGARLTRRIPARVLRWLLIAVLLVLLARTVADLAFSYGSLKGTISTG